MPDLAAPPFEECEPVRAVRRNATRLAKSDLPILLVGELGTGRRTLATAIARERCARGLPLVELTGFDGISGRLREVTGAGTVILAHHVEVLDARGQVALAQHARDRRSLLVATTHPGVTLHSELAAQTDATTIALPPLRERPGDLTHWVELFLTQAAASVGRSPRRLSHQALGAVLRHQWPANLIELDSVIRKGVALAEGETIELGDLGFEADLVVQPLEAAVEEFRMRYVGQVLAHFGGNRTQAARALGVDPRTVFRYLAKTKDD